MESKDNCLGIVAALRREVAPLLRRQQNIRRLGKNQFGFNLNGTRVVLGVAGAGADNAYRVAAGLIRECTASRLLSIGFAGGLSEALGEAELFIADRVIDEDTGEQFECQNEFLPVEGRLLAAHGALLSTRSVIQSAEQKRSLAKEWDAMAVDMESSGVARASKQWGVPFGAIKSITDSLDRSLAIDFQGCRSDDGRLSYRKIVREGLSSPSGFRELWRLAEVSRQAAGKLAVAIGSM